MVNLWHRLYGAAFVLAAIATLATAHVLPVGNSAVDVVAEASPILAVETVSIVQTDQSASPIVALETSSAPLGSAAVEPLNSGPAVVNGSIRIAALGGQQIRYALTPAMEEGGVDYDLAVPLVLWLTEQYSTVDGATLIRKLMFGHHTRQRRRWRRQRQRRRRHHHGRYLEDDDDDDDDNYALNEKSSTPDGALAAILSTAASLTSVASDCTGDQCLKTAQTGKDAGLVDDVSALRLLGMHHRHRRQRQRHRHRNRRHRHRLLDEDDDDDDDDDYDDRLDANISENSATSVLSSLAENGEASLTDASEIASDVAALRLLGMHNRHRRQRQRHRRRRRHGRQRRRWLEDDDDDDDDRLDGRELSSDSSDDYILSDEADDDAERRLSDFFSASSDDDSDDDTAEREHRNLRRHRHRHNHKRRRGNNYVPGAGNGTGWARRLFQTELPTSAHVLYVDLPKRVESEPMNFQENEMKTSLVVREFLERFLRRHPLMRFRFLYLAGEGREGRVGNSIASVGKQIMQEPIWGLNLKGVVFETSRPVTTSPSNDCQNLVDTKQWAKSLTECNAVTSSTVDSLTESFRMGDLIRGQRDSTAALLANDVDVLVFSADDETETNQWLGSLAMTSNVAWQGADAFRTASMKAWYMAGAPAGEVKQSSLFPQLTFLRLFGPKRVPNVNEKHAISEMLMQFMREEIGEASPAASTNLEDGALAQAAAELQGLSAAAAEAVAFVQ